MIGRSSAISLFPTSFAPRGVVQVELVKGVALCTVSGTAHASVATADYEAVVRYWNGSAYQTAATVTPSNVSDPLTTVPFNTAVGGGHTLGDYVASWSSDREQDHQDAGHGPRRRCSFRGGHDRLQPVWKPDTTANGNSSSAVSVTLGALKCSAQDQR